MAVPLRVEVLLEADETPLATLHGLAESGFVLTDRRLVAWRGNGVGSPLPLGTIDRVLVDTGTGSAHTDVLVVPRWSVHQPLVLDASLRRPVPRDGLRGRADPGRGRQRPAREEWGPVFRAAFGPV